MSQLPSPLPILFVHDGAQWIRGSERVLIDHIAELDRARFRPIVWTNNMPLVELMKAAGVEVLHDIFRVALTYSKPQFDFLSTLRLRRRAAQIIKRHQISIIHCNAPEPCQWVVPIAKRRRVPVILQLHLDYTVRLRCVCLLHQVSRITGVSRATLQPLINDGFPESASSVVYNCVDSRRLSSAAPQLRATFAIDEQAFVFLAVGSLIQRKGFDLLIDGFAKLQTANRSAVLVIAGDGPERARLEEQARTLGVAERVRFLGETPIAPALMRDIADAFVLTSRVEAFPLVLIEAGFFGLPCIGAAVGGVAELIEQEKTGLIVPPENPQALSVAMNRLMSEPQLAQRVGETLKARVLSEMVAPAASRRLEAIYEQCLADPALSHKWKWFPVYSRWIGQMTDGIRKRLLPRKHIRPAPTT